jgi:hypothetical protein
MRRRGRACLIFPSRSRSSCLIWLPIEGRSGSSDLVWVRVGRVAHSRACRSRLVCLSTQRPRNRADANCRRMCCVVAESHRSKRDSANRLPARIWREAERMCVRYSPPGSDHPPTGRRCRKSGKIDFRIVLIGQDHSFGRPRQIGGESVTNRKQLVLRVWIRQSAVNVNARL